MSRTVGIEEEFLLFASHAAHLVPAGEEIVHALATTSPGHFDHELKLEQAELGTDPHRRLDTLEKELRVCRRELAGSALQRGARLAALATCPVDEQHSLTPDARYRRMQHIFGRVVRLQLTCGQHVHVAADTPDEGVAVIDRMAPWLSVLVALTANSPYFAGQDTGYASFRTLLWGQWPTAGLGEPFGSLEGYRRATEALLRSGAAMDNGMLYFDARLSSHVPTVEIRVPDVSPYVDDAVTIAGLCRAMVETAAREWRERRPAPEHRGEPLRAARWRAARYGMDDSLYDVCAEELVPAWELVDRLTAWVADALVDTGDADRVHDGLALIRSRGNGAQLQRSTYAGSRDLAEVVTAVARATCR